MPYSTHLMEQLPQILQPLADPNVAFLLFVVGALGLTIELVHPNAVTGIVGAVCLILAFIGFGTLPLNVAGLLLIALGFLLFLMETQIVSHGLLTVAGVVAIAVGASILYTPGATQPPVHVDPVLIAVVAIAAGALAFTISWAALRTRRMRGSPGTVGVPIPIGSPGVVQMPLEPLGTVYLAGETWSARTPHELPLPRDAQVRLVEFDGLIAVVEPDPDQPAAPTPA